MILTKIQTLVLLYYETWAYATQLKIKWNNSRNNSDKTNN